MDQDEEMRAQPWVLGEYQLTRALLQVLTRELGPNFAGAVREELLARITGLDKAGGKLAGAAAAQARDIVAEPMWDDLTGRRPDWSRYELDGRKRSIT